MIIAHPRLQWIKSKKPNKAALVLCGLYSALAVPLLALAVFERDIKSAVVLQQVALIPFTMIATIPRIYQFIVDRTWLNNMYVGFAISLSIVYVAAYIVCWSLIFVVSFVAVRRRA
ncbi:hypothetical protein [Tardiphaga sp. OK245]|jgi:hypothetical protein|uniref:hypothetical protein n=1 Tax=Tardiphaga sp. OK245 TaxID=1855306 RepID=UPI0008A7C3DE|nr:hypothetical protein [Tardiphaga sp. OK245]SEI19397.1 hypothetical protein SAMN05216367_4854 [Tardiphaga sp. OK245]